MVVRSAEIIEAVKRMRRKAREAFLEDGLASTSLQCLASISTDQEHYSAEKVKTQKSEGCRLVHAGDGGAVALPAQRATLRQSLLLEELRLIGCLLIVVPPDVSRDEVGSDVVSHGAPAHPVPQLAGQAPPAKPGTCMERPDCREALLDTHPTTHAMARFGGNSRQAWTWSSSTATSSTRNPTFSAMARHAS